MKWPCLFMNDLDISTYLSCGSVVIGRAFYAHAHDPASSTPVRGHYFFEAKKPKGVSFVDAAGCIGDAVKAYTGLHYLGRLTSGDTVLVMDGASSFGAIAVQLAQHWGAKVITTVSSDDEALYLEALKGQVARVVDLRKTDNLGSGSDFHTGYTIGVNNNNNNNNNVNNNKSGSATALLPACMQESGGLGIDLVLDNGVTQFADTNYRILLEDTYKHPVPTKHDIVSCLAVGGRWITSKSDLQETGIEIFVMFALHETNKFCKRVTHYLVLLLVSSFIVNCYSCVSFFLDSGETDILMDIMEKVSSGVIRPNIHHTVPFEAVPDILQGLLRKEGGEGCDEDEVSKATYQTLQ
ncbi:hypothetical protein HPB48_008976 [Haemaphysalis longicornis]|uniref:Enoyl reductase (ER) domain-containing protein n=1 Tax=Haemaphysalis longicornis TaxID=44386 RepID=A0A9J6H485_HAELO|nr:hypothetical protein HPB48_008976 [Haemaphysalis longicornis]